MLKFAISSPVAVPSLNDISFVDLVLLVLFLLLFTSGAVDSRSVCLAVGLLSAGVGMFVFFFVFAVVLGLLM